MTAAVRFTVTGAVQGVGFRPFVKELADGYHLAGRVKNSGGIVRILVTDGEDGDIAAFARALKERAPAGALVLQIVREEGIFDPASKESDGVARFVIEESDEEGAEGLPVFVPDIATCGDCLAELGNPADRRYRYPLISCSRCGPRYTILHALPYDRKRTTMREFGMCCVCSREYAAPRKQTHPVWDPAESPNMGGTARIFSRRRHAQTISCHDCGPQMRWVLSTGGASAACDTSFTECQGDAALNEAVRILREGGVVGLKGVGGFQLLTDPCCDEAVRRIRRMKGREAKPFAVLFPSLESVRERCEVSDAEATALISAARPIVLLAPRAAGEEGTVGEASAGWSPAVLGGSAFVGAFLPASGVHQMLADVCGPLVATSANRSGEPMCFREEDFVAVFFPESGADGMLTHDREILAPVDDSVVFVESGASDTQADGGLRFIRRARGYVPLPLFVPGTAREKPLEAARASSAPADILAFGADMKAAFALARGDRIVVSQPFGDLEDLAVQRAFCAELARLLRIYDFHPSTVVCDAHPAYQSARLALQFATAHGLSAPLSLYHHHAHALAVMAEYGLESCVAVVCDGTGYGPDGTIWGGEVLCCRGTEWERRGHLPAFRLIGGDAAARDAALSAASWLFTAEDIENPGLSAEEMQTLRAAYAAGAGTFTTSAGRLFDAAACILGIARRNRFEGECAQALEAAAHRWLRSGGRWTEDSGEIAAYMNSLPERLRRGAEREQLAYGFHVSLAHTLAQLAAEAAETGGGQRVVLAGGCFANRLLLLLLRRELAARGLAAFVGAELPAGDGGLAAGQAYYCILKAQGL